MKVLVVDNAGCYNGVYVSPSSLIQRIKSLKSIESLECKVEIEYEDEDDVHLKVINTYEEFGELKEHEEFVRGDWKEVI